MLQGLMRMEVGDWELGNWGLGVGSWELGVFNFDF